MSGILPISEFFMPNQATQKTAQQSTDGFANMLNDAIQATNQTELADQQNSVQLATGNVDDLANAMIAAERADLSLRLTLQVRNKIIDAYNQIITMQV